MNSKENFGYAMEISNNPEYLKAIEKKCYELNTNYLSAEIRIKSLANTIATYAQDEKIDSNKINYLNKAFILGKIDGGAPAIHYINSQIVDETKKISEYDIMMHRLEKIFPKDANIFSSESLSELEALYSDNRNEVGSTIIKIAYNLEMVYAYLLNNNNYNWIELKKNIILLCKKVGELYKKTKNFKLTEDIDKLIKKAIDSMPEIPPEIKENIDVILNEYNNGNLNKNDFIENISELKLFDKNNEYTR